MFAPSRELAEAYAATAITDDPNPRHRATQELIRQYILQHLAPDAEGHRARCLMLVFRGPDAVTRIMNTVGHIVHERTSAETIRDTYGDYIADAAGNVTYFEPAVLAAPTAAAVESGLKLWASYSDSDGGVLEDVIPFPADAKVEKTLVLIKPDNFRFPNARPGGVIDLFSRTGLSIIGFKRAAHERRAGGGILRPGAGSSAGQAQGARAASRPGWPSRGSWSSRSPPTPNANSANCSDRSTAATTGKPSCSS